MDIYFYEAFQEESRSLREYLPSQLTIAMTHKTIQEAGDGNPPARLISIRTQSVIPIGWAENLDGVLSRSTGYDHLKTYLATTKKHVPCGYLPEYATRGVAEHAILLMMAIFRKLPEAVLQANRFTRDGLTGHELQGKNLLVLGVGRIGGAIAELGLGLGMQVRGVDIVERHSNVLYVSPEIGLPWADAIICAMNLTNQNIGYFSERLILQTKPGVIIVNVGRGEHTPTSILLRFVENGHLGGVGLDVYENESLISVQLRNNKATSPASVRQVLDLMNHPNVILTPHNAFNTVEAVDRKSRFTVNELEHFLTHRKFLHQC